MLKAIKITGEDVLKSIPLDVVGAPIKFIVEGKQINKAEIHNNVADLFFLISGEVVFTCNGKLIDPKKQPNDQNTFVANKVENGTEYCLKANDWLFIPADCPHQRATLKKSCFVVIKIPKE